MNKCALGGYLVDGTATLPADPIDHHVHGLPLVGCTRVRCSQCRMLARNVVGLAFRDSLAKVDLGQLYDVADLAASPLLGPSAGARTYLCRCRSFVELTDGHALAEPESDSFTSPNLPWSCDGHPLAELPRELDGVLVTPQNLGELVARSLHGWVPPGARPQDGQRAFWVARMYTRLAGTPWADAVPAAAAACLDDADPAARARALQFFFTFALPVGMQRALELLDGDRRLFAGVPDAITPVEGDKTLEDTLWRVVTPLVASPGRARDLAHAGALAPGKGSRALYAALTSGDPEWVAAHGEDMIRATPALGKELIKLIKYRFPRQVPAKPVVERLTAFLATMGS